MHLVLHSTNLELPRELLARDTKVDGSFALRHEVDVLMSLIRMDQSSVYRNIAEKSLFLDAPCVGVGYNKVDFII